MALAAAALCWPGGAQLISCKDKSGRTRLVSSAEQCGGKYQVLWSEKQKGGAKKSSRKASPGKLPKVSKQRQGALDKKRAQVLFYELKSERQSRETMDEAIAATSSGETRVLAAFKKQRDEHERNIVAIRQELARLGYANHSGN